MNYQKVCIFENEEFSISGKCFANCCQCEENEDHKVNSNNFQFRGFSFFFSFIFKTKDSNFRLFIEPTFENKIQYALDVNVTILNQKKEKSLNSFGSFVITPYANKIVLMFKGNKNNEQNFISSRAIFRDHKFFFDTSMCFKFKITYRNPKINNSFFQENNNYLLKHLNQDNNFTGLYNQGSTCYLNSILQALYHLPAFRKLIYQIPLYNKSNNQIGKEKYSTANSVVYNLQDLFLKMEVSEKCVSTERLIKSFGWMSNELFKQNDAPEFLKILLDNLEKVLPNNIKNGISDLFNFKMKQIIKCTNVNFSSERVDDFFDLTLDVRGYDDIYSSLKQLITEEKLDAPYQTGDSNFGLQEATICNSFKTLPKILCVHLKRFEYETVNGREKLTKINDRFVFPKVLNLESFEDENLSKKVTSKSSDDFDLFGVLVHSGFPNAGHYSAFLRPGLSKQWYKFNDSLVTQVSEYDAIQNNYGNNSQSSNGYFLIYINKKFSDEIFNLDFMTNKHIKNDIFCFNKDKILFNIITENDLKKSCADCSLNPIHSTNLGSIYLSPSASNHCLFQKISYLLGVSENAFKIYIIDDINGSLGKKILNTNSPLPLFDGNIINIFCKIKKCKSNQQILRHIKNQLFPMLLLQPMIKITSYDLYHPSIKKEFPIFIKMFNGEKIEFIKSIKVNKNDHVNIILKKASIRKCLGINEENTIKFYAQQSSTIFYEVAGNESFLTNKINKNNVVVIQNINKSTSIKRDTSDKNIIAKNSQSRIPIIENLPNFSNSFLYYINMKYNMCETLVYDYYNPSKKLFILKFCILDDLQIIKHIISKNAGINYNPSQNTLLLYSLTFEDNSSLVAKETIITKKLSKPIDKLYFRFFDDTPDDNSSKAPIAIRIGENREILYILLNIHAKIDDITEHLKYFKKTSHFFANSEFEISYSLEINNSYLFPLDKNITVSFLSKKGNVLRIDFNKINISNSKLIPVSHGERIDFFSPFYLPVFKNEFFLTVKEKLIEKIKDECKNFESFNKLKIVLKKSYSNMSTVSFENAIKDDQILYQYIDKRAFLYVDL